MKCSTFSELLLLVIQALKSSAIPNHTQKISLLQVCHMSDLLQRNHRSVFETVMYMHDTYAVHVSYRTATSVLHIYHLLFLTTTIHSMDSLCTWPQQT